MSSFWGKDGNIGVSMKGWEHRGVLGFGMERLGVSGGMGSHHYLGFGDGKVGGSIEGWEHRAVLGFGMGRLGVSMKEWENIIIVG